MITVIDAGLGNFKAVANMYKYLEIDVEIQSNPKFASGATHVVLPGVGAFDNGMKLLEESGWKEFLIHNRKAINILGVCLGMQLLGKGSEEGTSSGLALINFESRKFNSSLLSVPHMGWSSVEVKSASEILLGVEKNSRYYFSHSYYVPSNHSDYTLATATYGTEFSAVVQQKNIFGFQFHPEKSHKFGMKILQNFADL